MTPATTSPTVSGTAPTVASSVSGTTLNVYSFTPDSTTAGSVIADQFTVSGANSGTSVSVSQVSGATTLQTGDRRRRLRQVPAIKTTTSGNTMTFYVAENTTSAHAADVQYYKYTVSGLSGGVLDSVDNTTVGTYTDANGNVTSSSASGTGASISNINIASLTNSAADQATLNALPKAGGRGDPNVTASASALGTARSRITSQSSFVQSLQTSINDGVGSLVDADLNVASTRLQALQVQQQLGVQSLSIANQSTQAILKLFQ